MSYAIVNFESGAVNHANIRSVHATPAEAFASLRLVLRKLGVKPGNRHSLGVILLADGEHKAGDRVWARGNSVAEEDSRLGLYIFRGETCRANDAGDLVAVSA